MRQQRYLLFSVQVCELGNRTSNLCRINYMSVRIISVRRINPVYLYDRIFASTYKKSSYKLGSRFWRNIYSFQLSKYWYKSTFIMKQFYQNWNKHQIPMPAIRRNANTSRMCIFWSQTERSYMKLTQIQSCFIPYHYIKWLIALLF